MNDFTKAALFFPSLTQCWFVLQMEISSGTSAHADPSSPNKCLLAKSVNTPFKPVFTAEPLLRSFLTGERWQRGAACSGLEWQL